MRKYFFSLACLFVLIISVWAQDESLAPGINERFKQQPDQSIQLFDYMNRDPGLLEEILDACGLKPGMDVADIGAGSGVHARLFAEKVLPAGKVYAVDIVQEFLDHIDTTSKENGIKNIKCILGSDKSCNLKPSYRFKDSFLCCNISLAFLSKTYIILQISEEERRLFNLKSQFIICCS